jgi:murein DD-endopeptidase MepM/ murein hydrolase activator NlpD
MSELPQARSRRELRERERAAVSAASARPARRSQAVATAAPRTTNRHRIASKLLSAAAMVFVAALAIGMSVPASAFSASAMAPAGAGSTTIGGAAASTGAARSGVGSQTAAVANDQPADAISRDGFQVLSWAQVLAQKYSHVGASLGRNSTGTIRWPFPYPVTISSPFGPRIAPCSGCSTYHEGVDFTPGANAAIFAVAAGIVTGRDDTNVGYGNYVIITSQLNGHTVKFTYAHMTHASSPILLGQKVQVGDFIGLVGETGEATGPHLHFEVNVDGTTIDPIPWLEANVN